jgi:hypothetical protein
MLNLEDLANAALRKPHKFETVASWLNVTYEGELLNELPHGRGSVTLVSGKKLIGEFHLGHLVQGKAFCEDKIVAEMRINHHECFAKLFASNGNVYEGTIDDDQKFIRGKATNPDGVRWEGTWVDNQLHGKGSFTYPNGSTYEGDFVKGVRHGQGTWTGTKGTKYVGGWRNDCYDGFGLLIKPDGATYEGEWTMGQRSGVGTITLANGVKLKSSWRDDRIDANTIELTAPAEKKRKVEQSPK